MTIKQIYLSMGALCAAVMMMGASCDTEELNTWFDPDAMAEAAKPPEYVVTIHEIIKYKRADMLEIDIPGYFQESICVNKNYFLHSKEITQIELVERKEDPGMYNLLVTLSERGQKMWIALSVPNQKRDIAFVVDGRYYKSFAPKLLKNDTDRTVTIEGPFDPATAMGLTNNAEKNYKKLNK